MKLGGAAVLALALGLLLATGTALAQPNPRGRANRPAAARAGSRPAAAGGARSQAYPSPAPTPSGPPDCTTIKGCLPGMCSQRSPRGPVRCAQCDVGFMLRAGQCNTCAPGYAGKDVNGQKFDRGCGMCADAGAVSMGGPISTSQCLVCPPEANPINGTKCGCPAGTKLSLNNMVYKCVECSGFTISQDDNTTPFCTPCANGQIPNRDHTDCVAPNDPDAMNILPPLFNVFHRNNTKPSAQSGRAASAAAPAAAQRGAAPAAAQRGAAQAAAKPAPTDPIGKILSGLGDALQPVPDNAGLQDEGTPSITANLVDAFDHLFNPSTPEGLEPPVTKPAAPVVPATPAAAAVAAAPATPAAAAPAAAGAPVRTQSIVDPTPAPLADDATPAAAAAATPAAPAAAKPVTLGQDIAQSGGPHGDAVDYLTANNPAAAMQAVMADLMGH